MKKRTILWLLMLLLCFASAFGKDRISIASFNLCIFGQSKAEKSDVMNCMVQILRNFDIIAVQEIRDKEETALLSSGTFSDPGSPLLVTPLHP